MNIKFKAIVAHTNFGIIGKGNTIPWVCKEDMNFFSQMTKNSVVVMGRKTCKSLPSFPLKNRLNLVVTRNPEEPYEIDSVESVKEIVLKHYNDYPSDNPVVWIIGGTEIYDMFRDVIDEWFVNVLSSEHNHIEEDSTIKKFDQTLLDNYFLYNKSVIDIDHQHFDHIVFTNYLRKG